MSDNLSDCVCLTYLQLAMNGVGKRCELHVVSQNVPRSLSGNQKWLPEIAAYPLNTSIILRTLYLVVINNLSRVEKGQNHSSRHS
jgi:DNA polymerase III psi subunit